jgi:hypothetical protein
LETAITNPMLEKSFQHLFRLWDTIVFDIRHGVNTAGLIDLSNIESNKKSAAHTRFYEASPCGIILRAIDGLDISHNQFCFIDIGSGKGRALLMAGKKPFREVIGVELFSELNNEAINNIEKFRNKNLLNAPVKAIATDVLDYEFPDGDTVIYLFNPFDAEIIFELASNLKKIITGRIIIIYCQAVHHETLISSGVVEWKYDIPVCSVCFFRHNWISNVRVYANFSLNSRD